MRKVWVSPLSLTRSMIPMRAERVQFWADWKAARVLALRQWSWLYHLGSLWRTFRHTGMFVP